MTRPTAWCPGTTGSRGAMRSPSLMWRSVWQTPQHSTASNTSPAPGSGSGRSRSSRGLVSIAPGFGSTQACMGAMSLVSEEVAQGVKSSVVLVTGTLAPNTPGIWLASPPPPTNSTRPSKSSVAVWSKHTNRLWLPCGLGPGLLLFVLRVRGAGRIMNRERDHARRVIGCACLRTCHRTFPVIVVFREVALPPLCRITGVFGGSSLSRA